MVKAVRNFITKILKAQSPLEAIHITIAKIPELLIIIFIKGAFSLTFANNTGIKYKNKKINIKDPTIKAVRNFTTKILKAQSPLKAIHITIAKIPELLIIIFIKGAFSLTFTKKGFLELFKDFSKATKGTN